MDAGYKEMKSLGRTTCLHSSADEEIHSICREIGLHVPEVYMQQKLMAELAEEIQRRNEEAFCILPFCHTVEAEAMGGIIHYGDEKGGPRGKEPICRELEEVLKLGKIDFSEGRIHEVLLACRRLREKGEQTVLQISGPFTILSLLTDIQSVFKAMRRQPELLIRIYQKIGEELLLYIQQAQEQGVQIISYADAAAGPDILGPRWLGQVTEDFTYPFLKEIEEKTKDHLFVILCPMTARALLERSYAVMEPVRIPGRLSYGEGCIQMIGKEKFCGQMCLKGNKQQLRDGMFQSIKLK